MQDPSNYSTGVCRRKQLPLRGRQTTTQVMHLENFECSLEGYLLSFEI